MTEKGADGVIATTMPFSQLSSLVESINELRKTVEELRVTSTESQTQIAQMRAEMSGNEVKTQEERSQIGEEMPGNEQNYNISTSEFSENANATQPLMPESVTADRNVKLYDLPQFGGNAEEWPLFYANFMESTQRFNYPEYMNLMRLQKALVGQAREAVASLLIFPSDVPKVIEELKFQFGRSDILVRDQLKKIHDLPHVSLSKPDQIVEFSTKIRNVVALLSSTNCTHHLSNAILLDEVVGKLPLNQQLEWAKHVANLKTFATLLDFLEWLNKLARVVCEIPPPLPRKEKQKSRHLMHLSQQDEKKTGGCYSCQENHQFQKCPKYIQMPVEDKWKEVQKHNLCFSCLRKGHNLAKCTNKKPCGIDNCGKFHHKTLHSGNQKSVNRDVDSNGSPAQSVTEAHVMTNSYSQRKGLFKILPVTLYGPFGYVDTFAIIDEGSAISLLEENVAKSIGLQGKLQPLTLMWYGQKSTTEPSSLVQFEISGTGTRKFGLKRVQTVNNLNLPKQTFNKMKFSYLENIELPEYVDARPTLLLGLDNAWLGAPSEIVEGRKDEPIAAKTRLGWIAYGPSSPEQVVGSPSVLHIRQDEKMDELHQIVKEYFNNDNFGTNYIETKLESDDDKIAKEILSTTTKYIGNGYEVGLLWKKYPPDLPESFEMAKKRLLSLEKRMEREPEFAHRYRKEMQKYFDQGYARYLTPNEIQQDVPIWYLPHFAVTNPNKPGKLRIVFDAAAKINDISLNTTLLKGPEQPQSLQEILFKFRQEQVAVAADIREMFSQVKIRKADQHVQRFLWRDDPHNPVVSQCLMSSMIFGAICSLCCAEFIKNYNADMNFLKQPMPSSKSIMLTTSYVDFLLRKLP